MSELKFKETFKSCENITLKHTKLNESNVGRVWKNLKLSKIVTLDLSSNEFKTLHVEEGFKTFCLFEGFKSLIVLNISHNPIDSIHPNVFAGLVSLVHLNLSNTDIGKDHHFRCIKNLPTLKHLDVSGHQVYDLSLVRFAKTIGVALLHLTYLDIRSLNSPKSNQLSHTELKVIEKQFPKLTTYNGVDIKKAKNVKRESSIETIKNRTSVNNSVFFKEINNKLEQNMKEIVIPGFSNKENCGSNNLSQETKYVDKHIYNNQNISCFSPHKEKTERNKSMNKSVDFADINDNCKGEQFSSLHEYLYKRKGCDKNVSQFTFKKSDKPDKSKGKYLADLIDRKLTF